MHSNAKSSHIATDRITTFPIARVSYHSSESRRMMSSLIVQLQPSFQPRNRLFLSPNDLTFLPPFAFFTCLLKKKKKTQLACLSLNLNVQQSSSLLCFFQFSLQGRGVTLVAWPLSFIMFIINISTLSSKYRSQLLLRRIFHLPSLRFDVPNHFQP